MTGLTLVLGGQKSGKSGYAARRAARSGRPVTVVTPASVRDDEFAARVARHQADRPGHWRTLETFDLAGAVATAGRGAFVLVDALDTWLAERLERAGLPLDDRPADPAARDSAEAAVLEDLRAFAAAAASTGVAALVIAGQPGLGVHAGGPGARAYVDLHGIAVQALSAAAEEVLLVVAGRALPLPSTPPDAPSAKGWPELRDHGDRQVPAGAVDLAVNVEPGPPGWLAEQLVSAVPGLARYPDDRPARAAIAERHQRDAAECLPVNGAADALWAVGQALRPRLAACVHPSFTEPEAALRSAGVPVTRVFRDPDGWTLDPASVPAEAGLVVVGRPDNPTGVLDPVETVERLARPGRIVVVDEAFADFLPDASGFAARRDLPGVVAVRSLTKLWGLAGLRVGYLTGPPDLVSVLDRSRQPWTCNALALVAIEALTAAEDERCRLAAEVAARRDDLVARLSALPHITVHPSPANFVLIDAGVPGVRERLIDHGLAVRRAETFPGLDNRFIRVAVRDSGIHARLADALRSIAEFPPASIPPPSTPPR